MVKELKELDDKYHFLINEAGKKNNLVLVDQLKMEYESEKRILTNYLNKEMEVRIERHIYVNDKQVIILGHGNDNGISITIYNTEEQESTQCFLTFEQSRALYKQIRSFTEDCVIESNL